jgi:hypothetical protein
MAKKGYLAAAFGLGLTLISFLGGCVTTEIAGPVAGGVSYGLHSESTLFSANANLQKVNVQDMEDISGDLKAIASFSAVGIDGDWVIGNYQVVKLFGYIRYQKAAKVKKDLYKDPQ